jgi:hypothetical protein
MKNHHDRRVRPGEYYNVPFQTGQKDIPGCAGGNPEIPSVRM